MGKKIIKAYKIYKPKKDGTGSASQFSWSEDKRCIFLEMSAQLSEKDSDGNSTFDWKNKLSFKLGDVDMAQILCVLRGIKNNVGYDGKGIFHSFNNNNAILKFQKGDKSGYYLGISVKKEGLEPVAIKHSVTDEEGIILNILLSKAIELIYDWS